MADIMDEAREYLAEHEDACGNENCIGYDAREVLVALLDEVERLRGDAELGRLVRDVMTRLSGTHPVNRYPALLCWSSESWEVQYIHESGIYDTDEDELSATPEDALRKADA